MARGPDIPGMPKDWSLEQKVEYAELLRRSYPDFVQYLWDVVEPGTKLTWNWHIDAICRRLQEVAEGKIRDLVICVPPGTMKPVWEEEEVHTAQGRKRLKDVVVGDCVLTDKSRFRPVLAVHEQGTLPLLTFQTASGRTVSTAADHLLLTTEGYARADALTVNDVLALAYSDISKGGGCTEEEARVLGYLVGDGCTIKTANFVNMDPDVLQDFRRCAEASGLGVSVRSTPGKSTTTLGLLAADSWLQKHGLKGCTSYTKRIPPAVLLGGAATISNFLGALFSCDGTFADKHKNNGKNQRLASLTTVSKDLAFDVVHAALQCGIQLKVRKRTRDTPTAKQGAVYTYYMVESADQHNVAKMRHLPGLCPAKASRLVACRAQRFDGPLLQDPIVAIREGDTGKCRCLTVWEDSSFTVNDIVVHNSSLTSVFYDPWVWLTTPEERTLVASHDLPLVTRDNVKSRRVVKSDKYQELRNLLTLLGHHPWDFAPDQNQKQYYENTRGGFRQGVTVGGGGTGKRGDKRVTDDPHKIKELLEATPERQMELVNEVKEWYNNVFNSRLNDLATGKSILIMQRVHEEDLAGDCFKDPSYTTLVLPMCWDPDIADPLDPRTTPGELLFPKKFTQEVVDKLKRTMLPDQWEAQYQQRPIPAKGGLIKKEWCNNRYRFVPDWRSNTALPPMRRLAVSMDTANKAKKLSDPSVLGLWGEDVGGNLYLLDLVRERLEYADLEPRAEGFLVKHQPHITVIEDAASGAQLLSKFRRLGYRVVGEQPFLDKHSRMAVQTPWFQTGKVWLPDDTCPWILEYLLELWRFPQVKHDDQVDMTSQMLKYFFENVIGTFEYRVSSGIGFGDDVHEVYEEEGLPTSAQDLLARLFKL